MDDVSRLILEAWERLGPGIKGDPEELARRLARRRMAILQRPPRAWCIALRASDRRITPAHWVISPEHAMDLDHPAHAYEPIEHEVIIRPHALRKFCRPVSTDSWGEFVEEVSRWLGVNKSSGLSEARRTGAFEERRIKGLGGKRGKPVPLIHSWEKLDPSGPRHFSRPDKLWGSLWEFLPDFVPDDFEQTIVRRPVFQWMGDHNHHPTKQDPYRSGRGIRPPEIYRDDMQMVGWKWVCPGCRREVRKIFYPVKPRTLFDFFKLDPMPTDADELLAPPATFACFKCHHIRGDTRTSSATWNLVVSHITRGLLHGREVPKPSWYRAERKVPRRRRLGKPAVKREGIFLRMMNGWTIEQIGLDLKISRVAVRGSMAIILRQEGVKNRHELAAKLGWKHEQPLNANERVLARAKEQEEMMLPMLLAGLSRVEMAERMRLPVSRVVTVAGRIYRRHGIGKYKGRRELARKVGVVSSQ